MASPIQAQDEVKKTSWLDTQEFAMDDDDGEVDPASSPSVSKSGIDWSCGGPSAENQDDEDEEGTTATQETASTIPSTPQASSGGSSTGSPVTNDDSDDMQVDHLEQEASTSLGGSSLLSKDDNPVVDSPSVHSSRNDKEVEDEDKDEEIASLNLSPEQELQDEEDHTEATMNTKKDISGKEREDTDKPTPVTVATESSSRQENNNSPTEPTPNDKEKEQETPTESPGIRRSRRSRRPRQLFEPADTTPARQTRSAKTGRQPSAQALLRATGQLFLKADRNVVTVKDICESLQDQFQCVLPKASRKRVREHLTDLIRGTVEVPSTPSDAEENEEEPVGDKDDEEQSVASEEEEQPVSEASDEEEDTGKKAKRKRKSKRQAVSTPRTRPNRRKAAQAARLVQAERLRKKRMDALKVRNEELQLPSKEDQERAEAISAKFDTQTDEQRLQRLEDRLTLLQLLDQTRLATIEALEDKIDEDAQEQEKQKEESAYDALQAAKEHLDSSSSEEESSDEEELEVLGDHLRKPLPQRSAPATVALGFLSKVRSPTKKPISKAPPTSPNSFPASPTRNRSTWKSWLKSNQRRQGNLWLARELGYQDEKDHIRDCQAAAEQKRTQVQRREADRIAANERSLLRQRILQADEVLEDPDEPRNEEENEGPANEEEDDEEMLLAKEIGETPAPTPETGDEAPAPDSEETQLPTQSSQTILGSDDEGGDFADTEEDREDNGNDEEDVKPQDTSVAMPTSTPMVETKEADPEETQLVKAGTAPNDTQPLQGSEETLVQPSEKETVPDGDDAEEAEATFEEEESEMPGLETQEPKKPRNAGWQEMLRKEAEKLKKQKGKKPGLVEDQAEEEEEEEVAGLEDFGFSIKKKKNDDEEEDAENDVLDAEDLEHVVDELSDGEGDEEAGKVARKKQEQREEKERHKEIMRRMREGYDGRRGGIAGSGVGARGIHRFDQLVAADNREDAKRLGLLNEDELDSDDEKPKDAKPDDEDDEAAFLDKVLKDRFLHRSDVNLEENFSDDEEDNAEVKPSDEGPDSEAEEERTQERLAKRFAKRARMQRLEEEFADSEEFSQQRLIDEDESMRQELSQMKNGLLRRNTSTSTRSSISSIDGGSRLARQSSTASSNGGNNSFTRGTSSLSFALRASRKKQTRTSFLGGLKGAEASGGAALIHKTVALSHVVFTASRGSGSNPATTTSNGKRKSTDFSGGSSLFNKVARKSA
eukprot:Nitzschia sp. Nitz4//scaffold133_size116822//89097//92845//NITZ4_003818-RA/size116822-snap-gene-0.8-mRNA-1//1//CDS//3329535429//3019//frame0